MHDFYGEYHSLPIWRIVYSEDQFEKRLGTFRDFTSENIFIRELTEVREVPKYRQWIQDKWVLERVMPVDGINAEELTEKLSYEPVWVFEDKHGNPLPPKWEVIEIVLHAIHSAAAQSVGAKYKMPESDKNPEARKVEIDKIMEEIFGNETDVSTALEHQSAIVVPNNYKG